jgi:hypothetical protein
MRAAGAPPARRLAIRVSSGICRAGTQAQAAYLHPWHRNTIILALITGNGPFQHLEWVPLTL